VDDAQVGTLFRAVRLRRGWRQADVAQSSGTSQQLVSLIEVGRVEQVGLPAARRVATALSIRLRLEPLYRGADAYRLLDAGHAAVVDRVVRRLQALRWTCEVESTFNHFGDRGSVDILASLHDGAVLAIIEVKTRVVDVQDTLRALDRKVRVVPLVLRKQRTWRPREVGRILVLPDTTANRRAVTGHSASFSAALPGSSREVLRWLRSPRGSIGGVWFLSVTTVAGDKRISVAPRRVRRPGSRSGGPR
jgi:transcriptional regulator with XRE-family HTH domain